MRHVRKQYNRFSFRISILGTQVDAGESYETEQEAGVYADLTKHYLQTVFSLGLEPSLDPEVFNTEAYRRNVDLSSPYSVLTAVPERMRDFIAAHTAELEAIRDRAPERSPWEALRASPDAMSAPMMSAWVVACECAELDVEAFASLNGKYFLALMDGLSSRASDMLKPLSLAIKMHEGVVNAKLVGRLSKLTELQTNLNATAEYVEFLAKSLAEEQLGIAEHMAKLEANRPPLV